MVELHGNVCVDWAGRLILMATPRYRTDVTHRAVPAVSSHVVDEVLVVGCREIDGINAIIKNPVGLDIVLVKSDINFFSVKGPNSGIKLIRVGFKHIPVSVVCLLCCNFRLIAKVEPVGGEGHDGALNCTLTEEVHCDAVIASWSQTDYSARGWTQA